MNFKKRLFSNKHKEVIANTFRSMISKRHCDGLYSESTKCRLFISIGMKTCKFNYRAIPRSKRQEKLQRGTVESGRCFFPPDYDSAHARLFFFFPPDFGIAQKYRIAQVVTAVELNSGHFMDSEMGPTQFSGPAH